MTATPTPAATTRRRYVYVDLARGFAISLALFSHILQGMGGWSAIPDDEVWMHGFRIITRIATPTFILLFGVSIELAYVRQWGENRSATQRRLLRRALQCYIALAFVALASAIGTVATWPEMLLGLVFIDSVNFGNIFTFYVFALLLALLIIPLRRKIGLLGTLAITLLWYPIAAALRMMVQIPAEANVFFSRIFGIGTDWGPSVFHSMAIFVAGMIIANFMQNSRSNASRARVIIVLAIAAAAILWCVINDGPRGMAEGFVYFYREANEFGYYAIGGFLAITVLAVCWALSERTNVFKGSSPGAFGGNSLQAFAVGNIILNLLVAHFSFDSFWVALSVGLVGVLAYWLVFREWIKIYQKPMFNKFRAVVAGKKPAPTVTPFR